MIVVYKVQIQGDIRYYFDKPEYLELLRKINGSVKCMSPGAKEALEKFGASFFVVECTQVRDDKGRMTGVYRTDDGWEPPFQRDEEEGS